MAPCSPRSRPSLRRPFGPVLTAAARGAARKCGRNGGMAPPGPNKGMHLRIGDATSAVRVQSCVRTCGAAGPRPAAPARAHQNRRRAAAFPGSTAERTPASPHRPWAIHDPACPAIPGLRRDGAGERQKPMRTGAYRSGRPSQICGHPAPHDGSGSRTHGFAYGRAVEPVFLATTETSGLPLPPHGGAPAPPLPVTEENAPVLFFGDEPILSPLPPRRRAGPASHCRCGDAPRPSLLPLRRRSAAVSPVAAEMCRRCLSCAGG
jgi:hypothetical protein